MREAGQFTEAGRDLEAEYLRKSEHGKALGIVLVCTGYNARHLVIGGCFGIALSYEHMDFR
jgi:hypothetical protein